MWPESRCRLALAATLALASALALPSSAAAQVLIDYVEGEVELEEERGWRELFIGEEVSASARIWLDNHSLAQLGAGDSTITLTRRGVYALADLLPKVQVARQWNLAAVVGSKLTGLTTERQKEGAVFGVRGDAQDDDELMWMDDGTSSIVEVRRLNEDGEYAQALQLAVESAEFAFDDEADELGYHAMYAAALLGDPATALRHGAALDPDPLSGYYADYVLVLGKLFLESAGFVEAAGLFDDYLLFHPQGASAQAVHVLASFASQGLGDQEAALSHLRSAVALAPESETGVLAQSLLPGG